MPKFFTSLFLLFGLNLSFSQDTLVYPKTEFRGVWIATVANIDWPIDNNDDLDKQKKDYIALLDYYKQNNFNAVLVQIRTAGDAFYETKLAPWSKYLTGKQGLAPKNKEDILPWLINQSHQRGFEFHAWMNPYRATMDLKTKNLSENHDFNLHPNWMIRYGEKYYYNPGLPEVQAHLVNIVNEVVAKYDVDAIHFDDYFYPYTIEGEVFNDFSAYKQYGNGLTLEDWRRKNVNDCVAALSQGIKNTKNWVQFGISPFGVWRNKSQDPRGSETATGQNNYDNLFADVLNWTDNALIDYVVPQIYFSLNHPKVPYNKLQDWWALNTKNSLLYIGNAPYKINTDKEKSWKDLTEISKQIDYSRSNNMVSGNVYFSAKSLYQKNQSVLQGIKENQYKYLALPPVVNRFKTMVCVKPTVLIETSNPEKTIFNIENKPENKNRYLLIYASADAIDPKNPAQIIEKFFISNTSNNIEKVFSNDYLAQYKNIAFSFINVYGNESELTNILSNKK